MDAHCTLEFASFINLPEQQISGEWTGGDLADARIMAIQRSVKLALVSFISEELLWVIQHISVAVTAVECKRPPVMK
jgi:hydrogenase maturation factor